MRDEDYRSAMGKVRASREWKDETARAMRGAQEHRPRAVRPKLALACAAAALACALCLPAVLGPGMTAGGEAAAGAAQSAAAFAAEAPGTAQPEAAQAREASPDAAAPKLASAGGAAASAAGDGTAEDAAAAFWRNPTAGLSQEALPAQLPLYADGADGGDSAEAQLQKLLDGAVGAQSWTYTAHGAAVTAAAADGGALLARPAGAEEGDLCEAYAQALSARRTWQADAGECYALAGEGAGVPEQLYAYRFERLRLAFDGERNLASVSWHAVHEDGAASLCTPAQAAARLGLAQDAPAALDYERGGDGVWRPVYRFLVEEDGAARIETVSAEAEE